MKTKICKYTSGAVMAEGCVISVVSGDKVYYTHTHGRPVVDIYLDGDDVTFTDGTSVYTFPVTIHNTSEVTCIYDGMENQIRQIAGSGSKVYILEANTLIYRDTNTGTCASVTVPCKCYSMDTHPTLGYVYLGCPESGHVYVYGPNLSKIYTVSRPGTGHDLSCGDDVLYLPARYTAADGIEAAGVVYAYPLTGGIPTETSKHIKADKPTEWEMFGHHVMAHQGGVVIENITGVAIQHMESTDVVDTAYEYLKRGR